MPKISSSANSSAKMSDSPAKMTDIALRKKKNADAQAAFRARRTNYIQTLEETVTNLESVVLQLQDSCRDARNEAQELRQENGRLRLQLKEREHFWRTVWSRKNQSDGDDFPALPPGSFNGSLTVGSQVHQYGDVRAYREDSAIPCTQTQSPIGAYSTVDTDVPGQRTSKYSSDAYFSAVSHPSWPAQSVTQSSSSGGELGIHPSTTHAPNSPNYTNSPPLASPEVTFPRFPSQIEDQKVSVTSTLESTPFVFSSSSRSLTPTVSTPPTSSTTPLAPFQFRVSDAVHERPHPPGTGSLSGAPPNGSLGTVGNDGRYRPGSNRRDGPLLPTVLPPLSGGSDNGSQHGSDGDSGSYPSHQLRPRLSTTCSRTSCSPSPGVAPQISGTLAVLKAQSFGALRRTRTRTKRPVESAAKVAMDVLESRGLGMSVQTGVKRQRRCEDEGDGGS